MRSIYVPVFDRFFESSIMREQLPVRFVMLALIRLAWRSGADGSVDIDPVMLAASINIPYADVEAALNRLMEPDPDSHTPDEDGRRIVPLDPARPMRGWRLVNWQKYRVLVNRLNDAARKRDEYHESKDNMEISESLPKSPEVSGGLRVSPKTAKISLRDDTRRYETRRNETSTEISLKTEFEESFWDPFPRKVGRATAFRVWSKLTDEDRLLADEGVRTLSEKWKTKPSSELRFCPHPATWLNGRRWEDQPEPVAASAPAAPAGASQAPSGDYRLPTGGFAAADRSWFDYRGERYYGKPGGYYRTEEGYAPDGTHKQNVGWGPAAQKIVDEILSPVPVKP